MQEKKENEVKFEFIKKLYEFIEEFNLTQKQLADILKVCTATVFKWLKGDHTPFSSKCVIYMIRMDRYRKEKYEETK